MTAAIVTGAGRGIGRAIARTLAAEGHAVTLVARTERELEDTAAAIVERGGEALPCAADVRDERAVRQAARAACERFGAPALLVNNAGAATAVGHVWEVRLDDWRRDVETSLYGAFLMSRAVLPQMLRAGGGRIVNITSTVAFRPSPRVAAYAAAKAALVNFTESLAAEAEEHGVTVFAVAPGFVRTKLVAGLQRAGVVAPRGDDVDPQLVAGLVCRIAAGELDALSGRLLHARDDVDALLARADEVVGGDLLVPRVRPV